MRSRRVLRHVAVGLLLVLSQPMRAQERTPGSLPPSVPHVAAATQPHVRPHSTLALQLIRQATQESAVVRSLVDRLNRSDVIVYVELDMRLSERTRGRLRFIGAAGGRRYLDVRIARLLNPHVEMATLAHELQHAVEIAEAPEVVDARSMDAFYRRIGFSISARSWHETDAAVATGLAVLRELRDSRGSATHVATGEEPDRK